MKPKKVLQFGEIISFWCWSCLWWWKGPDRVLGFLLMLMIMKMIQRRKSPVKLCKRWRKNYWKQKKWWKKLREVSREFFLILEAKLKKFLQTGPKTIHPGSVPVWLLVDKGFSCECFWRKEEEMMMRKGKLLCAKCRWKAHRTTSEASRSVGRFDDDATSLHRSESVSYENFCGVKNEMKFRKNPVPAASKFYVSIVIVGVVKMIT